MPLSTEQVEQVTGGLNMILKAVGASTIEELVAKQQVLLEQIPVAQRDMFVSQLRDNVANQFASTIDLAASEFEKALDEKIKEKEK
jgi:hypothetical protein